MDLTQKQQEILDAVSGKKNVLVTGPAGCGKSYLIQAVIKECNRGCAATAMTGIAATLLPFGKTLHSWGGIGLAKGDEEEILSKVRRNKKIREQWQTVELLIIDEVSMLTAELFEKLDYVARKVRKIDKFFGGIQLLLCGDFCQLPPVGSSEYCFQSELFMDNIDCYLLDKIFRQQHDPIFQDILNGLRFGVLTSEHKELLKGRIVSSPDEKDGIIPTQLFPTNVEVNNINEKELEKLLSISNEIKVYGAISKVTEPDGNVLASKHSLYKKAIELLEKSYMTENSLKLCVGAQVMLVYNLSVEEGLANGSRGVVTGFLKGNPIVRFLNGIERAVVRHEFTSELSFATVTRQQIPLKLAWAITIHKSQGLTLDYVVTNLRSVFIPSQIYVSLSRVKCLEGLFLTGINFGRVGCDPVVKEFYEQLQRNAGTIKKKKVNAFSQLMKKGECLI